jgi:serine/threonine protein kinase
LGKGGFGVVMKARNKFTGKIVAVKIIDKIKHSKHMSLIEKELKILQKIVSIKLLTIY